MRAASAQNDMSREGGNRWIVRDPPVGTLWPLLPPLEPYSEALLGKKI